MDPKLLALAIVAVVIMHTTVVTFGSKSDQELFFGVIVGDKGNEGVLSGIQGALDDINGNSDLLHGYKLKYDLAHSEVCKHNNVIIFISRLATFNSIYI